MRRRVPRFPSQRPRRSLTSDDDLPTSIRDRQGAIEQYDIVACRRTDARYELRQFIEDELIMIRAGTLGRPEAAAAALQLARREQSNAWIQDGPGTYRLVGTWKQGV